MIWRSEQLLKFVEIPFVYSLLIIPFSGGHDLPYYIEDGKEHLNRLVFPLIFILGITGGALSIVDPFGKLCKGLLRLNRLNKEINDWFDKEPTIRNDGDYFKPSFLIFIRKNFWNHGINTLPINTEINKIVGMLYFVTLIIFLWIFLPSSSYALFTESLTISNFIHEKNPTTIELVTIWFKFFFFISIIAVFIICILSLLEMRKKVRTAAIFLYGVSHSSNSWTIDIISQLQDLRESTKDEKISQLQDSLNEGKLAKEELTQMHESMMSGKWELAEEYSHAYYKTHLLTRKFSINKDVDVTKGSAKNSLKFKWPFRNTKNQNPIQT